MRYKLLTVVVVLFICNPGPARASVYTYNYSANCSRAYEHFMALQFKEGDASLLQEMKANPYNLMATYLGDYQDCLQLLFNGDKTDYEQRKDHMDERLDLLEKGNENDPWQRLCRAGIYLHWALVHVRFGDNFKAVTQFRKSFQLLKENRQQFPSFEYNDIFFGVEETVVGAMPEEYKWAASVLGMKGDVKRGVNRLSAFINTHTNQQPLRLEAVLFHSYLRFYLMSQQEEVWSFLNSKDFPVQNNLLHAFVKANIGLNFRKADIALQVLKTAQTDDNWNTFPILNYEVASCFWYKLDPTCINYFDRFLSHYKGRLFVKESWQRMAQSYYLERNMPKANYCLQQVKKQGTTQVDADKQAFRSADAVWPNYQLLQARILIDGGYYAQAFEKLGKSKESDFTTTSDKLEYYFRLARIYDELGDDNRAIQLYQTTINMGREQPEHFAARSALQMGFIYEHAGKINEAVARYKEALSIRNHDFQASIDQQAKAGINRLTVK